MLAPILPLDADGKLKLPAHCAIGALAERQSELMLAKSLTVCGDAELCLDAPIQPSQLSCEALTILKGARCWVGPFAVAASTEEAMVEWLDQGAAGLLVGPLADDSVETLAALPRERVCLVVPWDAEPRTAASLEAAVRAAAAPLERAGKSISSCCSSILVRIALPATETGAAAGAGALAEPLRQLGKLLKLKVRLGFVGAPPSVGDAGALHCAEVVVHACVALATPTGSKVTLGEAASVGAALVACARTDRADGLLTTVVVDEGGVCLGLVYSSAESVQESVRAGRGIYFSRSRNSLWRKGDTSGATQELVRVEVDCDSDALRFTVRQLGEPPAFCHLGTRTCWGEAGGLYALQRTLQGRKASAPIGSYSKRLFDEPALLRHKLLEEAQVRARARGQGRGREQRGWGTGGMRCGRG
jgi:phosphoribosyl-ATP pyrophosphohydrolase/phosphoribosyl-AMP cyclohydrolase/histidinol dehydrogenase